MTDCAAGENATDDDEKPAPRGAVRRAMSKPEGGGGNNVSWHNTHGITHANEKKKKTFSHSNSSLSNCSNPGRKANVDTIYDQPLPPPRHLPERLEDVEGRVVLVTLHEPHARVRHGQVLHVGLLLATLRPRQSTN